MSHWLLMANVLSEHICRTQCQPVNAIMAYSVAGLSG